MKPKQVPKHYIESHCQRSDLVACDYLIKSIGCPRTCNFAQQYHPIHRAKFLAARDALVDMGKNGLDTNEMESEFFGRRE